MFKNESMFLNGNKVNAGTIIGFEVVRNRSYFSPKSRNGYTDTFFSTNEIDDDFLPWVYIGTTIHKGKKCVAFLSLKPQFHVPLQGAAGYVNAKDTIDNVSSLLKLNNMFDISNITMPETIHIFGLSQIQIEELDPKLFVYGKSDYSPESFLKGEFEKEGKIESASASWICDLEDESGLLPDKPYWISSFSKNIVSKREIHFCISAYIDKAISPNCTLFSSNGEESLGFFGVRPIAYFQCKEQDEEKKTFSSATEYIEEQIERYGIGVRAF